MKRETVYISGPMAAASFCRGNCPAARSMAAVSAGLKRSRRADSVLLPDVRVRHPGSTVFSHSSNVSSNGQRSRVPERNLLLDPESSPLPQERKNQIEELDGFVPVADPCVEGLLAETSRRRGTIQAPESGSGYQEIENVLVSGRDLHSDRAVVPVPVDDRALSLVESSGPCYSCCVVHGCIVHGLRTSPWDFNYHAFDAKSDELCDRYWVRNPAWILGGDSWTWQHWMRAALKMQMGADVVHMLPGWRKSRGARIERRLALILGQRVEGADA